MKPVANDKSGIDPVVLLSASADVAMAIKQGAANEAQAAITASFGESQVRGVVARQEDAPMNAMECSSEPDNIKEKSMHLIRSQIPSSNNS